MLNKVVYSSLIGSQSHVMTMMCITPSKKSPHDFPAGTRFLTPDTALGNEGENMSGKGSSVSGHMSENRRGDPRLTLMGRTD